MLGDDVAKTLGIKLRPTCTTENLHYVKNTNVNEGAFLCIVNFSSLKEKKNYEKQRSMVHISKVVHVFAD